MASSVFLNTVLKQIKGGQHEAELIEAAAQRGADLANTYTLRASKGGDLSKEDIQAAEMAAALSVDRILKDMAATSIEELAGQREKTHRHKSKIKVQSNLTLQDRRGRFITPLQLTRLLNMTLYRYAQEHMGRGGQLINRTGRLAGSGFIDEMVLEGVPNPSLSVYFSYMVYPYEVFHNPRYKHLNPTGNRLPNELFAQAIKSGLRDILLPKSLAKLQGSVELIKERGERPYKGRF